MSKNDHVRERELVSSVRRLVFAFFEKYALAAKVAGWAGKKELRCNDMLACWRKQAMRVEVNCSEIEIKEFFGCYVFFGWDGKNKKVEATIRDKCMVSRELEHLSCRLIEPSHYLKSVW